MAAKNKRLYIKIIEILERSPKRRRDIINEYISSLQLTGEQMADRSTSGKANIQRSLAGSAINEMLGRGMIMRSADGIYSAYEQKPIVIRNEKCEQQILSLLTERPMTKGELRQALIKRFGTDRTLTEKDDNRLFSYMGDILRRLTSIGVIKFESRVYSLPDRIEAKIDDISQMLILKESFLTSLHKRGGEFFEVYFMTLLGKFFERNGKTVLSNTTTGGSDDGGIDGIIQTVDCLGFKETVMVQTKNRSDTTNETIVRGFYGAVCARQGSRGIFATSSDFHSSAITFLDSIDNCVGVDGAKIFKMACEVHYGIKRGAAGRLIVDTSVI